MSSNRPAHNVSASMLVLVDRLFCTQFGPQLLIMVTVVMNRKGLVSVAEYGAQVGETP